jgi:acyl carrier protein
MSVKAAVMSEIRQLAAENGKSTPDPTDDLVLLDSGLDSLAIAILVVRLEETLGFDPFAESSDTPYPVTLGDFIRLADLDQALDAMESVRRGAA